MPIIRVAVVQNMPGHYKGRTKLSALLLLEQVSKNSWASLLLLEVVVVK
jgi:hypothetical protein